MAMFPRRLFGFRRHLVYTIVVIFLLGFTVHFLLGPSPPKNPDRLLRNPDEINQARAAMMPHKPIRPVTESSRLAMATFLDVQRTEGPDGYFIGARVLTYQVLHGSTTKARPGVDWVVIAAEGVEQWKVDMLRRDGAIVHVVETIGMPTGWKMKTSRYENVLTKLWVFRLEQYDRVLYIDTDMLLQAPLDDIFFDDPAVVYPAKTDYSTNPRPLPPSEYVLAARGDYGFMGAQQHRDTPPPSDLLQPDYLNVGFFVTAPSVEMFEYLLRLMPRIDHTLNRGEYPEQDLVNWAFRRCDYNPSFKPWRIDLLRRCTDKQRLETSMPMPWKDVNWTWVANVPTDADFNSGVRALHEKFWGRGERLGYKLWQREYAAMVRLLGEPYPPSASDL